MCCTAALLPRRLPGPTTPGPTTRWSAPPSPEVMTVRRKSLRWAAVAGGTLQAGHVLIGHALPLLQAAA